MPLCTSLERDNELQSLSWDWGLIDGLEQAIRQEDGVDPEQGDSDRSPGRVRLHSTHGDYTFRLYHTLNWKGADFEDGAWVVEEHTFQIKPGDKFRMWR